MSIERRLGLRDDETLLSVARRAPVTLLVPMLLAIGLILAPLFLLVPLLRLELIGYLLIGVLELVGVLIVLRVLLDQQSSFLAVTDKRLIFVRQHGLFDRHVTELPYSRVQRVSYRVQGFLPTLFRYGTLLVESAGNEAPLTVPRVTHPARTQDLINELMSGTHGGFGDVLQSVSRLDPRQLALLKSEVDRTLRMLPPDERA